jgi:PAS domain S-box-containing protein
MKDVEEVKRINELISQFNDEYYWFITNHNGEEKILYSDNVFSVTGYTPEELISMPSRGNDIIFDEDIKRFNHEVNEFKLDVSRNTLEMELRIVRKDDEIIWVKALMQTERNESGEILKFFGKVLNISSYKEREQTLKQEVDELNKVNTSKDNFISMLSHDLRAPFTSILGFSEILLNEINLSEKEKEEYLTYINDSSQNQLQLINDLLDWSRLQTGKFKISKQRVHAQSMVFNCISSLTGNAIRKNIDIKVDVPETLYIIGDERQLTQVMTNLLGNAIKFSPEQTTIEIRANIYNEKFLEIIVKDEGIGISEEGKEKLFKIGKVYSTEGTKGEKGTGLGLALTKQIVEKHNGEIWFYSTSGKGSEFHFIVPSSANSILIVKNDKEKKETFIKLLKEKFPQYQILGAENGYEALGIIISQMPSLIITDHEMPLMNGLQLIQSIRMEDKQLNIPVIVTLNNYSDEIEMKYKEFGIETFQNDLFDIDQLDDKLQTLIK